MDMWYIKIPPTFLFGPGTCLTLSAKTIRFSHSSRPAEPSLISAHCTLSPQQHLLGRRLVPWRQQTIIVDIVFGLLRIRGVEVAKRVPVGLPGAGSCNRRVNAVTVTEVLRHLAPPAALYSFDNHMEVIRLLLATQSKFSCDVAN